MNKILILTQPLGFNYGGILQAYALQRFLKINNNVETLEWNVSFRTYRWLLSFFKRFFLNRFLNRNLPLYLDVLFPPPVFYNRITINTRNFISKYINLTKSKYRIGQDFSKNKELFDYNVYIAGSDQVWACSTYNKYVKNCMFDFLINKESIKRISYAASFGKDGFFNNPDYIQECKQLLQKFNAISVREDSGVRLCKDLFDVNAIHVIDPTMFFDAEHYINLSKERSDYHNDGDCFAYILDMSDEKQKIINRVCNTYNLKSFSVKPKSVFKDVGPLYIKDCVIPPVEQWLEGFNKAKFIITDSFHGCVFSIIFKKPFIAIGNAERGMARFESLLHMFKLENRLIHSENDLTEELLNSEIDYDAVHEILAKERKKAEMFLLKALS
jgi:hypothetical protein